MKIVLIYNSKSGGEFNLRRLKPLLRSYGLQVTYSFTVQQLHSKKLKQLIDNGAIVAAVGGDGTLNAVARLLVNTKSTFLPLPGGTFNHFVRDLGMSPILTDNLDQVKHFKSKKIDIADVNGELFLNNSNLGLYPFSLIERKQTKKIFGKWIAALLSAFDQFVAFKRHRLTIDGNKIKSPFVFIGNNVYDIESSLIPQRHHLTNGVLTMMVASSSSRTALIKAIFSVIRGNVSGHDDFVLETRKKVEIYSPKAELLVSLDGEVKKLSTPLIYEIKPKALRILMPIKH